MLTERTRITDEATAQRVLGISLETYLKKTIRFEMEANEAVFNRHAQEWAPWMDQAKKDAFEACEELRDEGLKTFISSWKKFPDPDPYDGGNCSLMFKRDVGVIRHWLNKPKDIIAAKTRIWKSQWKDSDSDFWRCRYYWYMMRSIACQRSGGDYDKAAAELNYLDDCEILKEFEARKFPWYDALAERKAAANRDKAEEPGSPHTASGKGRKRGEMDLAEAAKLQDEIICRYVGQLGANPPGDKAARDWAKSFAVELYSIGVPGRSMTQRVAALKVQEAFDGKYGAGRFVRMVYSIEKLRSEVSKRTVISRSS